MYGQRGRETIGIGAPDRSINTRNVAAGAGVSEERQARGPAAGTGREKAREKPVSDSAIGQPARSNPVRKSAPPRRAHTTPAPSGSSSASPADWRGGRVRVKYRA